MPDKKRTAEQVFNSLQQISKEENVDFGLDNYTPETFKKKYFAGREGAGELYDKLNKISDEIGMDFGQGKRDEWLASFGYDESPQQQPVQQQKSGSSWMSALSNLAQKSFDKASEVKNDLTNRVQSTITSTSNDQPAKDTINTTSAGGGWRDKPIMVNYAGNGTPRQTTEGAIADELYGVFAQAYNTGEYPYGKARDAAMKMGIQEADDDVNMTNTKSLLNTATNFGNEQVARRAAMEFVQGLPEKMYNSHSEIAERFYSREFQESLNDKIKRLGAEYPSFVRYFKPALESYMKERFGYDYKEDIGPLFENWEDVFSRMENNDAINITGNYLGDSIDKEFAEFDQKADSAFTENYHHNPYSSAASAGQYLVAKRSANEANDPDKVLQSLKNKEEALFRKIVDNPQFKADITKRAEAIGLSPAEYVEQYVVPNFTNSIVSKFEQTAVAREMPKDSLDYIMRGITEDSVIGMLLSRFVYSESRQRYRNQASALTEQGKNPDVDPNLWMRTGRLATNMVADAWLWAGSGKAASSVVNRFVGARIATIAAERNITIAAARRIVEEEASRHLGKRIAGNLLSHVPQSSITMGLAGGGGEAARAIRDRENFGDAIGSITGKVAHDAAVGGAFGVTSSIAGGMTARLTGAKALLGKLAAYEAEAGTMYTTEELSKMMNGEDAFQNPFTGIAEANVKLAGIKLSASPAQTAARLLNAVAHPVKTVRSAMKGKFGSLTDADVADLQSSTDGKTLMDALVALSGGKLIKGEGERQGYATREEMAEAAARYHDYMTDPERPADRKQRVARVLGTMVPPPGKEVSADITQAEDGTFIVKTRDIDGQCVSETRYDSEADAQEEVYAMVIEFKDNLIGALRRKIDLSDTYGNLRAELQSVYEEASAKQKAGVELTEREKQAVQLRQHVGELIDIQNKLNDGKELTDEERSVGELLNAFFETGVLSQSHSDRFTKEFESDNKLPSGSVEQSIEGHTYEEALELAGGEEEGIVYIGDGRWRTSTENNIIDAYIMRLREEVGRRESTAETATETNNTAQEVLSIEDKTRYDIETNENQGYEISDTDEKQDAKARVDVLREQVGGFLDENAMLMLDEEPIATLKNMRESEQFTDDQVQQAADYVNAKARYNGMVRRVQDDIDAAIAESDRSIDERVAKPDNGGDGMIHPATLKVDDKPVYIVSGNVKMTADGTMVDVEGSDKDIIVLDTQTGEVNFVDAKDIKSVDAAIDPEEERQLAAGRIREEMAKKAADEIDGTQPFNLNDEFDMLVDGKVVHAIVTQEDNGDGVEVQTTTDDGQTQVQVVPRDQLQQAVDDLRKQPFREEIQAPAEEPKAPAAQPQAAETEGAIEGEQQEAAESAQQTALSRIPVDERGGRLYEQASHEDSYDALVEQLGEEGAIEIAKSNVSDATQALKKLEKKKPTGKTTDEKVASLRAIAQERARHQATIDYWNAVQAVPNNRRAEAERVSEEEEKARREVAERREEEAKRQAREAQEKLNGVPDVLNDKAEDARARGYRNVNGNVVMRQEGTGDVYGREVDIKFSKSDTAKGHMKVIEADDLQPSHVNGQRNPKFFIDEAQPKDRTDAVSSMAAAKIASALNPEEITGGGSAYQFSAPTVNTRGEVVQGNNRSDALKLMYDNNAFAPSVEAYKAYLMEHADEFGLGRNAIASMKKPVLVNEIDVTDEEAIRLGQMKASDIESSGIERIDAKSTTMKLGKRLSNFANVLLSSANEEASLSELLVENGVKALKWLNTNGIISDTQLQSAVDRKGNITAEGKMDLQNILKQSLFAGGVSDLPKMFDAMPDKAQKAILSTFMRDMDSDEQERILPFIQESIEVYHEVSASTKEFNEAGNYEAAHRAMDNWTRQYHVGINGESLLPSEKFSNFAIELATRYRGTSMSNIAKNFNDFYDMVQGKGELDMFSSGEPGEKMSVADAIRKVYDVELKPKTNETIRSNAVGGNVETSPAGRRGEQGDGTSGEPDSQGTGTAVTGGRVEGSDVEQSTEEPAQPVSVNDKLQEARSKYPDRVFAGRHGDGSVTFRGEDATLVAQLLDRDVDASGEITLDKEEADKTLPMLIASGHKVGYYEDNETPSAATGQQVNKTFNFDEVEGLKNAPFSVRHTIEDEAVSAFYNAFLKVPAFQFGVPDEQRQKMTYDKFVEEFKERVGILAKGCEPYLPEVYQYICSKLDKAASITPIQGKGKEEKPAQTEKKSAKNSDISEKIATFTPSADMNALSEPLEIHKGKDAVAWVERNKEALLKRCRELAKPKNVLDPDEVRNILQMIGYNGKNVPEYKEAGNILVAELFRIQMEEAVASGNPSITFMSGIGGAGKGTSLRKGGIDIASRGVVYDAAFNNKKKLLKKMKEARDAGMTDIEVIVVHNDALTAFKNTIARGKKIGRFLGINYFLESYGERKELLQFIAEKSKELGVKVTIIPLDNTGNDGRGRISVEQAIAEWDYEPDHYIEKILKDLDYEIQQGRLSENQITSVAGDISEIGKGRSLSGFAVRLAERIGERVLSGNGGNLRREVPQRVERLADDSGNELEESAEQNAETAQEEPKHTEQSDGEIKRTAAHFPEETPEESLAAGYSIKPTTYTNKKGKTTPMHLVTFDRELSKDEIRAGKELAKESRGWWDREKGGFMMRSEESAKELAEALSNEETVQDAQPLSVEDMAAVNDQAEVKAVDEAIKVEQEPQTTPQYDYDREDNVYDTVLAGLREALNNRSAGSIPNIKAIEKEIRDLRKRAKTIEDGMATAAGETLPQAFDALANLKGRSRAYAKFLTELRQKMAEAERDDALAAHGVKLGDKVKIRGKEATIHDADSRQVTLDTGLAPVMYEVAEWENVELPKREPSSTQPKKVNAESIIGELNEKGEAKLSDHGTLVVGGVGRAETKVRFNQKKDIEDAFGRTIVNKEKGDEIKIGKFVDPNRVAIKWNGTDTQFLWEQLAKTINNEHWEWADAKREENKAKSKWVDDADAERFEELRKRLRAKLGGQLNMGLDPEAFAIGVEMSYLILKHGARKFGEFAKNLIEALGEGIRPYIKTLYNGARDLPEMADIEKDMTPWDEVRSFDVMNFDKEDAKSIFATAEHITREQSAEREAKEATNKLKQERNEQRKEIEQQVAADTETTASEAETVASEVESKLPSARNEREVNDLAKGIDDTIDKVNDQLALLGYYEAEPVEKDFNEAYGYMRNAEKKAVKNITALFKTLTKELGINDPVVYDAKGKKQKSVTANIAPAGGDVAMRIMLNRDQGVELYIDFTLEPDYENNRNNLVLKGIMYRTERSRSNGGHDYLGSNNYFPVGVTVPQMLQGIRSMYKEWLPAESNVAITQRVAAKNAENQKEKASKGGNSKKKSVSLQQQTIPDLFSGLFGEEGLNSKSNDTARTDEVKGSSREDGTLGSVSADRDRVLDTASTGRTDRGATARVSDEAGAVADGTRTGIPGQRSSRSATRGNNVAGEAERGLPDGGRSIRDGAASDGRGHDNRAAAATPDGVPSQTGAGNTGGRREQLDELRGRGNVRQSKQPEPKFKRNYVYPENSSEIDNMTPQQRLKANVEALEVLRTLMKEGREATPEEREILGKYRGWGGVELGRAYSTSMMRNSFTDRWGTPTEQGKLLTRLADVIDELDPNGERGVLSAINRAALTSYYTPTGIARAMNRFVELAGFKGGSMLDPSMGNGVFEGTMSKAVQQRTMIHGVELDWLTGQIARNLYPDANVLVTGYEQAGTADNAYDVVISNIPFGDISVTDKSWKHDSSPVRKAAQNRIHNYFAVKMLDDTRPGGLCVIMTSNAILDTKGNQIIREHIADNAEVLGVVRLPDNTFKGAGTSVVTDVIFLRKYKDDTDRSTKRSDEQYLNNIEKPFLTSGELQLVNPTDGKSYKVAVNGYFTKNKGMMIGEAKAGGQYRADQFGLSSNMSSDELATAVSKLIEKKIVGDRKGKLFDTHKTEREVHEAVSEAYKGDGNYISSGNIVEQDGMFGIVTSTKSKYGDVTSTFTEIPSLNAKASRIRAMMPIRKAMKQVIDWQIQGLKESDLAQARAELQKAYDDFTKKFGRLNDKENDFLTEDIDGYTLRSLERWKDGKFDGLSDIFTKNTIKQALDLSTAKTPADAISLSLAEYGEINPAFMEDALGASWAEQCGETLFRTPFTEDVYETADAYLSGDVKTKLEQAREAAKQDKSFERNVEALEAVQPKDIPFDEISIRMGARWIPSEMYTDFMYDMFGIRKNDWKGNKSGVEYMPEVDQYVVNVAPNELGGEADQWRTSRRSASEVFTAALQDKSLSVFDTIKEDGKETKILNKEETELLNGKIQDLRTAFEDWLSQNPEREEALMRLYNDKFNRTVLRKFDGSHLNVAGLMGMELRPHQKDAVWMLINNRGGIIDHIVGAGKTLVMQSAIMEMRRMGIAKKPMIIGLKATCAQIAKEFREAYPAARILAPTERDFSKENRKKFMSQIALNDYDCVILSHDQYCMLPHTEEVERGVIDEQMAQLDAAIEYLYGQSDKSQLTKKQIKGLEKRKANLEAKLDKLLDRKIDREFTFEGLGVDYLFVDECQHFKSLPYVSTYDRVAGLGDKQGSQRAIALLNGVRYLQKIHQGDRGTVFLSGTTISNSLSEIYHLLNYLRPSEMEKLGMTTFDAWAGNYAIHTAELEYGVTNELKEKDRFRSLTNIPELSKMYAEIADVRNDMNLKLPKPKMRSHIVTVPQSDLMTEINAEIVNMVRNKDGHYFGIDSKDTTPWGLLASTLSAKAAINPRLIDDAYEDEGGKIPAVCEQVKKIYDQFKEQKGTQLIFCDTGVPGKGKKYDAYSDIINRLVNDYGIPRKEIADIHEASTDEKRKALFAKVNDGSVRILIGGTKNMGTGVNVQKRIVAMHHVDVPWTPADREQREGRGVRQGNEIARDFNDNNVDVYFYATEGSLDMYKYQLQETKGKLFAQFKSGTIGDRTFDEGDADGDFDPAEVVAMLSGNPVIFEKSKQDKKVEKLRRAKRAYESDWQRRRSRFEELKQKKRNFERLLSLNASDVRDLERGGFTADEDGKYPTTVTVQVKDDYGSRRAFDKPKEAGEYIHSLLKQGKKVVLSGFGQKANITIPITEAGLFGKPVAELSSYGGIKYTVEVSDDDTAAGVSFRNLLQKVYSNRKVYERNLEDVNNQLTGADPGENKFPKQSELDEALAEKKRLDDEYKKLSDENPKADDTEMFREGTEEQAQQEQKQRTAKEQRSREAFAERQWRRAKERAREWVEKLNISDRTEVYDSIDDVPGSENFSDRKRRSRGWYNKDTGKIVIVLGNHRNPSDVVRTILHEAVAHYGLRKLFGKNLDNFLDNVYNGAEIRIKEAIMAKAVKLKNKSPNSKRTTEEWRRVATEEYLAELAESTDFENADHPMTPSARHWFNKIKGWFFDMLSSLGLKDFGGRSLHDVITDNELRYILWRSYENLTEPGRYRNVFSEAKDIAMQHRLKVGEFDRTEVPRRTERVAAPEERTEQAATPEEPRIEQARVVADANSGNKAIDDAYKQFKEKHSDAILLVHMADGSYRAVGEDKQPVSTVFGESAFGNNGEQPYYAVPERQLDLLLPNLIRRGNKVAIMEEPTGDMAHEGAEDSWRFVDETDDNNLFRDNEEVDADAEGYDAGRMTFEESISDGLVKLAQKNKDDLDLRVRAMRQIGGNLAKLRQAMARQREYDRGTVDSIVRLAKSVIDSGFFSNLSPYEVKRLMGMVNRAAGREDITKQAGEVVDLLLNHQLKELANILHRQMQVKGSKLNAKGVEVQGQLDIDGQRMMSAMKDGMTLSIKSLDERIGDAIDRMGSDDKVTADNAAVEYQGLMLARQYVDEVKRLEDEEKTMKMELKTRRENADERERATNSYKEYVASVQDAIRENRLERAEAYNNLITALGSGLKASVERAKEWREREHERIREIQHNANSDLQGVPADELAKPTWTQRAANWSLIRFFMKPLATFDQMLRFMGSKSVNGEGYLWNRFMSKWSDASDKEWKNLRAAHKTLDDKVSEVFGKKMRWSDLFAMERKMPMMDVEVTDAKEKRTYKLTQGNLLYIYMVNKMSDGKMKLRNMGISEEDVAVITENIDPRLIELADWLQDEFLVQKRNDYNEVHERMFGAPMAAIENYFPLKINSRSRGQEEDIGNPTYGEAKPSTITGSVIKRTRNSLPLDITGADAFDVVLEHLQQMEHWAAFAEFNNDLNTLLSYKRFRNRVQNMSSARYGSGDTLWKNFKDVCAIAAGVYTPIVNRNSVDNAIVNIAKGVTASKIAFRIFTGLKQLLSYPAYFSNASIPELVKSSNPIGAIKAWNWAIENLPGFAERWQSRQAGDSRLKESDADWGIWKNKIVETASRWGMSPNAFVDGLTVAMGGKAIYETKLKKYKKQGYSEEQAKKMALLDASVAYNSTQQSSANAYLSPMQLDRTVASVALTVFRNASMGYQRQFASAIANLGRKLKPGYKDASIAFMAKQIQREWNSEEDNPYATDDGTISAEAERIARRIYNRSWAKDMFNVGLFGFVLQFAWNMGPYMAYLLVGDDDDKKNDMLEDAAMHALAGGVEGLSGGNIMSDLYNLKISGGDVSNYNFDLLPLMSDLRTTLRHFKSDEVSGWNDVFNLLMQSGLGFNPQTFTDTFVAIGDYAEGDPETGKEMTMLIMRILQVPQTAIDEVYIDELGLSGREARQLSPVEMAQRYAEYKFTKNSPLTGWAYSDEGKKKVQDKYVQRFADKLEERIEGMSDEALIGRVEAMSEADQNSPVGKKLTSQLDSRIEAMDNNALEDAFNNGSPQLRKKISKQAVERIGGKGASDSYASQKQEYNKTYVRLRSYFDLAEDVMLQAEQRRAEARGDDERVKEVKKGRAAITKIRQELGSGGDDSEVMSRLRAARRELISDLGL